MSNAYEALLQKNLTGTGISESWTFKHPWPI